MRNWQQTLYDLICSTSTDIPADVENSLREGLAREQPGSNAALALEEMLKNIRLAREKKRPLCQDTGTLLFWVKAPAGFDRNAFLADMEEAVNRATEAGLLRRNCVNTLTGENTGGNIGRGLPVMHWEQGTGDTVEVSLVLKGGGCENVGAQYALPHTELQAGRDLEGVRRCVLDAVCAAQGRGCAPGVLGVTVGGDRATGYEHSKKQFLRTIGSRSPHPELADLEKRLLTECNELGVGPMGFGGKTTVLDVFIDVLDRLPASYFVTVSYMCWSFRRKTVRADMQGNVVSPADG